MTVQNPDAQVIQDIQRSHIEANVPSSADFNRILQRDLENYFTKGNKKKVHVEFEMLRDGPTQSGVAYPKFYAWVRILEGKSKLNEGAVRLAAIDRKKFEVTDFIGRSAIEAHPEALTQVFPAAVCEKIKSKIGIAR